jgi:hypothetical protein
VSGYALHLCGAMKNGRAKECFDPENGVVTAGECC